MNQRNQDRLFSLARAVEGKADLDPSYAEASAAAKTLLRALYDGAGVDAHAAAALQAACRKTKWAQGDADFRASIEAAGVWEEQKHPRDHGKFSSKPGAGAGPTKPDASGPLREGYIRKRFRLSDGSLSELRDVPARLRDSTKKGGGGGGGGGAPGGGPSLPQAVIDKVAARYGSADHLKVGGAARAPLGGDDAIVDVQIVGFSEDHPGLVRVKGPGGTEEEIPAQMIQPSKRGGAR